MDEIKKMTELHECEVGPIVEKTYRLLEEQDKAMDEIMNQVRDCNDRINTLQRRFDNALDLINKYMPAIDIRNLLE